MANIYTYLKPEGEIPKIQTERFWTSEDVRKICVGANFYTCGTIRDYEKMLKTVEDYDPDPEVIYIVAKDIYDHSDHDDAMSLDIQSIMLLLEREAVYTSYDFS